MNAIVDQMQLTIAKPAQAAGAQATSSRSVDDAERGSGLRLTLIAALALLDLAMFALAYWLTP